MFHHRLSVMFSSHAAPNGAKNVGGQTRIKWCVTSYQQSVRLPKSRRPRKSGQSAVSALCLVADAERHDFGGIVSMEEPQITFEQIVNMARRLPPIEKLWLIERLALDLETALQSSTPARRRSLRGVLKGCSISEEDIDQARKEMCSLRSAEIALQSSQPSAS